jgi:hypothetical protein
VAVLIISEELVEEDRIALLVSNLIFASEG